MLFRDFRERNHDRSRVTFPFRDGLIGREDERGSEDFLPPTPGFRNGREISDLRGFQRNFGRTGFRGSRLGEPFQSFACRGAHDRRRFEVPSGSAESRLAESGGFVDRISVHGPRLPVFGRGSRCGEAYVRDHARRNGGHFTRVRIAVGFLRSGRRSGFEHCRSRCGIPEFCRSSHRERAGETFHGIRRRLARGIVRNRGYRAFDVLQCQWRGHSRHSGIRFGRSGLGERSGSRFFLFRSGRDGFRFWLCHDAFRGGRLGLGSRRA